MGPQTLHRLYCHWNAIKFNLIGFHKTKKDKMQRQGKTKSQRRFYKNGGRREMATTRNLFFSTRKEGRFVVSFNCAWFLNLLTRMSLLVTPKINDRPLMECHQKLSSHYMTYKNKVPSYWKYAGYEFILASELHLIASKSWFNLTSLWGSKSHKYSPVKPIELNVQRLYSINVRGLERQEENSGMTSSSLNKAL